MPSDVVVMSLCYGTSELRRRSVGWVGFQRRHEVFDSMSGPSDLMISISGVRGIVGRSLTPELLVRMGEAFGTYMQSGRVVVGRDTRVSGEMVKCAVFGGLLSTGCTIVDVGIVATPTATLMIEALKANGGVVISASHNPVEWNALKFFRSD